MKNIRIWSFSGQYFPAFRPNTERYGVSVRVHSECEKIRARKTPNTDTSDAAKVLEIEYSSEMDQIQKLMKTAQKNMYLRPKAKLNKRNINKDILNNG